MADEPLSTLEIKIQKFISQYGAEELIAWLNEFEHIWSVKEYQKFRELERKTCKECNIPLAEMKRSTNTESTNAKRIISLIALNLINLPIPSIAKLLTVSQRSVSYYIKDAQSWIEEPKRNKNFVEIYCKVLENIKMD